MKASEEKTKQGKEADSFYKGIIERFSITVDNERLPKIIFQSDEKTANAVRLALIMYSSFWDDIQLDFKSFPIVKTTIYCRHKANIDNFLELHSVRSAFTKEDDDDMPF